MGLAVPRSLAAPVEASAAVHKAGEVYDEGAQYDLFSHGNCDWNPVANGTSLAKIYKDFRCTFYTDGKCKDRLVTAVGSTEVYGLLPFYNCRVPPDVAPVVIRRNAAESNEPMIRDIGKVWRYEETTLVAGGEFVFVRMDGSMTLGEVFPYGRCDFYATEDCDDAATTVEGPWGGHFNPPIRSYICSRPVFEDVGKAIHTDDKEVIIWGSIDRECINNTETYLARVELTRNVDCVFYTDTGCKGEPTNLDGPTTRKVAFFSYFCPVPDPPKEADSPSVASVPSALSTSDEASIVDIGKAWEANNRDQTLWGTFICECINTNAQMIRAQLTKKTTCVVYANPECQGESTGLDGPTQKVVSFNSYWCSVPTATLSIKTRIAPSLLCLSRWSSAMKLPPNPRISAKPGRTLTT
ncbi:hypothetical protein BCR34DRAFT_28470 [Clohesyomyces aquaticus]|uniref:Uncharacterized protein n=1 Tax=Clohesyomyces aquaticus TaxID=1231657 RepID=A0A1Y1ZA50_9PLEO|nr:hypothetical protein BCR34DRAFT_28470 [Clohesyomyces aquaticus]